MTRVAIIGASHWHLDLYLPTLRQDPGVEVVGVSDPRPGVARTLAEELSCAWSTSYEQLCDSARPDFVFALGSHDEMFREAMFLMDRRIGFAMEKPCGLDTDQVGRLARRSEAECLFAAVPFVWRHSELLTQMRARFDDSAIDYMSFRWIAGPPTRYVDSGCDWMLDPARSGGGCTINLSVHHFDLVRLLWGPSVRVASAVMSNAAYGLPIEDYSLVVLRSDDRLALVETGYLFPGPHSNFDMRFSIKTPDSYLIATGPEDIEVVADGAGTERVQALTTNVPHYPVFVNDVLRRFEEGEPPVASMVDMLAVMEMVQDAYAHAGRTATRDKESE